MPKPLVPSFKCSADLRNLVPGLAPVLAALCFVLAADANAAEQAAYAFKGLVPGESTRADVDRVLGKPSTNRGYRYPVQGSDGLTDRLFFQRDTLEAVSAASPDPRYPSRDQIVKRLGAPECEVRFQNQEFLEYCEKGLRFICDASGKTTGVIYFAPRKRRVPADHSHTFDLRRDESGEAATPPAGFMAGAAELSIAPQRFDNLTSDAAEKPFHLHEDVLTRVAVFQNGDDRLVFVGLDVFLIGPWDLAPLRASLAQKGFPHAFVGMSHTHANVDTMGFYGYYPREYAEHIIQRTEEAVLKAAADMKPVKSLRRGATEMSLAGGRVVDLVINWRDLGVIEPTVSVIQAIGEDGKPILNLVHLTCHPEVIRLEKKRGISPDFVGALCKKVSSELGGQTVFLNGALGGMVSPATPSRTYEAAEEMGRELAEHVISAACTSRPMASYKLFAQRRALHIPVTTPALRMFLDSAPKPVPFKDGAIETEMNVVWLGDAQFITVPGELLPQLAIEMMAEMTGALRMVVGLANDELGYIIPSYDYHEGEYEERTGPGREAGDIVTKTGIELARIRPVP